VALVPETVKRLLAKRLHVAVETNASLAAGHSDDDYRAAGATVEASAAALWSAADCIVKLPPPTAAELALAREGSALISLLYPLVNGELVAALAAKELTVMSADSISRTTLAQMMDVLSSQATLAGYRAVILAAEALPKLSPMLMTAACTRFGVEVLKTRGKK